ncbi:MAG: hypothetical protein V8T30_03615 [Ruminococcus sp.]
MILSSRNTLCICNFLGNGETHLHWHLFPRKSGDLGNYGNCGKGPVLWYHGEM